ncbi:hypothetical protein [Neisseria weixii]|uniref:hypothetical protein n=1 Tax=Neisseria weixii TaxID=1853276 RepID=UPI0018F425AB|nr:hypothetical protein [Neisseria weixii]
MSIAEKITMRHATFGMADNGSGRLKNGKGEIAGSSLHGKTVILPASLFDSVEAAEHVAEPRESSTGNWWEAVWDSKTVTEKADPKYWKVFALSTAAAVPRQGRLKGAVSFNVLDGMPARASVVFDSWLFTDGKTELVERGGTIYKNWDAALGQGVAAGKISPWGNVEIHDLSVDTAALKITAGIVRRPPLKTYNYSGRTPAAPVKPESFTLYIGDTVLRADEAGKLSGSGISGQIDYETGFYKIETSEGFYADELRYNAVTQDNLPLDSSIIGIDSVRLPSDGRVPIYRKGDMIVIGNHLRQDLGSSFTAGRRITLNRQNIDRLCLIDADGKHVSAEKYSVDLKTGELTFSEPLDLSQYTMPLTASMAWEEENRITGVDISGRLKLQFALSRDYPQENTYVSSALIGGDLLVRATEPFSQRAWDKVWADARRGEEILAKLNVKDYPFKMTSNGAVTERWLIQFTGESQYQLYGEQLGLVLTSDTLTELAPANPATGKPYFRLPAAAFGGGWERGNCIRFNTFGTPLPVWVLRSVQPSPDKQAGRDGFTACLRGNTVAG